jgi:hypothetical protein
MENLDDIKLGQWQQTETMAKNLDSNKTLANENKLSEWKQIWKISNMEIDKKLRQWKKVGLWQQIGQWLQN